MRSKTAMALAALSLMALGACDNAAGGGGTRDFDPRGRFVHRVPVRQTRFRTVRA